MADDCGLASFWIKLKTGDVGGIAALFSSSPHIEEPFAGTIDGEDELRQFVQVITSEMRKCHGRDPPVWEHVETIITPSRIVCEWEMNADLPRDRWAPPVAAVGDVRDKKFSSIRVYYCTWPKLGNCAIRLPVLPEDNTIVLKGTISDYQRSLAAGDIEGILDTFEEDAIIQGLKGKSYERKEKSQFREFFERSLRKGGIQLRYCTVTSDGRICAIEYILNKWGDRVMPPQAGVAVYVQGRSGRIAELRLYNDVEPADVSFGTDDTSLRET